MTAIYPAGVRRFRWLFDAVEGLLAASADGVLITHSALRSATPGRLPSTDELATVGAALIEIGVFEASAEGWRFNRRRFRASVGYRQGVREGLELAVSAREQISLVAAVPPGLDRPAHEIVLRESSDLRLAVVDLIAAARHRVVLASPFWDDETVNELAPLLARRIAVGVRVEVLGRATDRSTASGLALLRLADQLPPDTCRIVTWCWPSEEDRFGTETFHFKVAIADDGERAYLGSANFTTAGLRSRMELGVIMRGDIARSLARLLDAVLSR